MIIITKPTPIQNEISLIHSLFAEGLELLHVRKPDYSEDEMKRFLSAIGLEFRARLVLHQHHQLAQAFGINRIHFTEKDRESYNNSFRISNPERVKSAILSTSVHSIEDFNALADVFQYAFLSPVFTSISKADYAPTIDYRTALEKRTNHKTKLIALGGIQSGNISQALESGFDGVALLGTIWNGNNPIENFKLCQQIAPTY